MRKFLLLVVPVAGVAVFAGTHYLPGTHILGQSVFAMTPAQAEKAGHNALSKTFTLRTDNNTYRFKLSKFITVDGDAVKDALHSTGDLTDRVTHIDTSLVKSLKLSGEKAPNNAYAAFTDGKVKVVKEYAGTTYDRSKLAEAVKEAISEGKTSLDARGKYYKAPEITADSESIKNQVNLMRKYEGHVITLKDSGKTVRLDWKRYMRHMTFKGTAKIDENWLAGYARSLNSNFSTAGKPVKFKVPGGKTLTAPGGTYGKVVNVSKEIDHLRKNIISNQDVTRNVSMTTSGNDTMKTSTFLLVSIANQTVTGYKNGKAVLRSSVVTGKETADRRTRRGAFYIFARRSPAVLRGPGYASPVHTFSAFDGGRGFHDAPWRSAFGGTIYRYSGSHGCVNMPRNAADKLYTNFGYGTPVMVI